jgi:TonB family protein
MKRNILFVLCLFISFITFGQEKKEFVDEIKGVKVTAPKFTGIEVPILKQTNSNSGALENYVIKQIQIPQNSIDWTDEGTVVVQFLVNPSGKLSDFSVINSVCSILDNEVIRALKTTNGMWMPGSNNDEFVPMEKEISISFRMENSPDFVKRSQLYYRKGGKMLYDKERPRIALRYFNQGIALMPNSKCILMGRGLAKYELGDKEGACRDWNRIRHLGGIEGEPYLDGFCKMDGFAEMAQILSK